MAGLFSICDMSGAPPPAAKLPNRDPKPGIPATREHHYISLMGMQRAKLSPAFYGHSGRLEDAKISTSALPCGEERFPD